jgi:hypothetical protein
MGEIYVHGIMESVCDSMARVSSKRNTTKLRTFKYDLLIKQNIAVGKMFLSIELPATRRQSHNCCNVVCALDQAIELPAVRWYT